MSRRLIFAAFHDNRLSSKGHTALLGVFIRLEAVAASERSAESHKRRFCDAPPEQNGRAAARRILRPLASSCATAKGRCWDTCFYRALSPTTANHRTKSTRVTNGFVEIKAARIILQARVQPLKR